ncbi:MAG: KH domain-containing protein [Clostridia bacterium]|nr:KH domain-containing protein [Clostridia bacterium]
MEKLVRFMVTSLVDNKDAINIEIDGATINVTVAKEDMGKIIGKQGRTAKAIRSIVKAALAKTGAKYSVEFLG